MLDAPMRDLASVEVWEASLERSRRRRVLAAQGRREIARRKQASAAVSAAMVVSPSAAAFAAASNGPGSGGGAVSSASPANRAIAPGAPSHLLRVGSSGPDVVRVQSALGQVPDGVFGVATDAAVRTFQSRNGLVVDGIVGPRTWGTLFGAHGASYEPAAPRYQFKIQRASSSEEAAVRAALAGRGAVAKIVLRTVPKSGDSAKPPRTRTVDTAPAPVRHQVRSPEPQRDTVSTAPVSTSCGSDRVTAPVKNYTVTGDFGESRPGHLHSGLDLAVPYGTPIMAAACGVVVQVGAEGGYGNIVCIKHNSTLTTCYAHMSRFATRVGERVHQGEVIGYVGCTGNCTGPHVHFETRVNGTPVDPAPYLSGARRAKTTHAARASNAAKPRTRTASAASASGPGGAAAAPSDKGGSTAKPVAASGPGAEPQATAEPTPAPAPAPAPATEAPAPAPAPVAAPVEAPAPAPTAAAPAPEALAPAPVAAAPAPVAEAPAPAPVEAPAPAPAPVAAPVEAPAPAPTTAAPAPEAPAPAPAAEAPAPAPTADAPAAPAPAAEAPAPVPAAG